MTNIEYLVDSMDSFEAVIELLETSNDELKIEIAGYYVTQSLIDDDIMIDEDNYYQHTVSHYDCMITNLDDYPPSVDLENFLHDKRSEILDLANQLTLDAIIEEKEGREL